MTPLYPRTAHTAPLCDAARPVGPGAARDALPSQLLWGAGPVGASGVDTSPARHFDSVAGNVGDGPETRRQRAEAAAAAAEARAAQARQAVGHVFDQVFGVVVPPLAMEQEHVHEVERDYVERAAAAEAAAMAAELAEGDYADSMGVWLDELHAAEEAARAERLRLIVEQEARDNAVPLHQRECSICLEALHEGENGAYMQLGCHETHGFHADCLARSWASDPRLRCPACRSPRVDDPVAATVLPCFRARQNTDRQHEEELRRQRDQWDSCTPAVRVDSLHDILPPSGPEAGGWHAVDHLSVAECVISPCGHIGDAAHRAAVRLGARTRAGLRLHHRGTAA